MPRPKSTLIAVIAIVLAGPALAQTHEGGARRKWRSSRRRFSGRSRPGSDFYAQSRQPTRVPWPILQFTQP